MNKKISSLNPSVCAVKQSWDFTFTYILRELSRTGCILLFIFFLPHTVLAQNDVEDFFKTGGDVYTAPFHFDKDDWTNLSITAAAATGAFFLDKPVKRLFLRNKNAAADFIFEIDKYFYIEGTAISMAGIYAYGAAADDKEIKNLGLQLAEATFFASTIMLISKAISGRSRPNSHCGPLNFNPFTTDLKNSSMLSAHSTLAFAFSTVMANYKDDTAWRTGWYTLSSLVAMARIYHNMHWFSDVVLGSALGYFVGEFVSNHRTNKKADESILVVPPPQNLVSFKLPF
ncbi:MAG: phosphatase PAP2 family protein [Ignavibacteriaceae bacterium]